MEASAFQDDQLDSILDPPVRIFERISQIAGYTWDESMVPIHSSYDNWYAALCVSSLSVLVRF